MATRKRANRQSQLRIIGGRWRSRKLSFTPAEGLRPTTDRLRETLFNWLSPALQGARCADLFAGSGALGLEALSRGAAHCDFVDASDLAVREISEHLQLLDAGDCGHCHRSEADSFLKGTSGKYDIVFIDPPFGSGLVEATCRVLQQRDLLADRALVYIENGLSETQPVPPTEWRLYREKNAGEVACRLYEVI